VIQSFDDERLSFKINNCNVGFAGNLDQVGKMATGDFMVMLSSDDIMNKGALENYQSLFESLGGIKSRAIISSSMDKIDVEDKIIGRCGPRPILWFEDDQDEALSKLAQCKVYKVSADDLLRRCILTMQNPFNFASTCFPSRLYQELEGYGSGRMIGPDKWFHWRLLNIAEYAIFIDAPLFSYRWHDSNQTAQQLGTGAIKYQVDQYRTTLEVEDETLTRLNLNRADLIKAFIEYDIARAGLSTLATGSRTRAQRILRFGESVYPRQTAKNKKARMLKALLSLGPVGQKAAATAYRRIPESSKTNPQL
jgi:hypothetical protein